MVLSPLKYTCIPFFLPTVLMLSLGPLYKVPLCSLFCCLSWNCCLLFLGTLATFFRMVWSSDPVPHPV